MRGNRGAVWGVGTGVNHTPMHSDLPAAMPAPFPQATAVGGVALGRRGLLALLAAPLAARLLAACGGAETGTDRPVTTVAPMRRSDLARRSTEPADAQRAAAAFNAFGEDMFRELAAGDVDNLVFSPASIALALAMTAVGAAGVTEEEMYAVLHADGGSGDDGDGFDPAGFDRSVNALSARLSSIDRERGRGEDRRVAKLEIANSVWLQEDFDVEQPFLDTLATEYGAGIESADFRTAADRALAAINGWVDDATHGRIPELLAAGDVDASTRLVLVNTVYLLATWAREFKAEATYNAPFTTGDGRSVDVDTMRAELQCSYARGEAWQAVELRYAFDEMSFVAVLPDEGAREVYAIDGVVDALAPKTVNLSMPKFDFETRTGLAELLARLGMPSAFSDRADFSAITTAEPLQIGGVIHQANITVDERGTEAAAATAVVLRTMSLPPQDEVVRLALDRPFTFFVRDLTTGTVVFAGRVADPSAAH